MIFRLPEIVATRKYRTASERFFFRLLWCSRYFGWHLVCMETMMYLWMNVLYSIISTLLIGMKMDFQAAWKTVCLWFKIILYCYRDWCNVCCWLALPYFFCGVCTHGQRMNPKYLFLPPCPQLKLRHEHHCWQFDGELSRSPRHSPHQYGFPRRLYVRHFWTQRCG